MKADELAVVRDVLEECGVSPETIGVVAAVVAGDDVDAALERAYWEFDHLWLQRGSISMRDSFKLAVRGMLRRLSRTETPPRSTPPAETSRPADETM
jgi:hypothetical protein